ncbi:MAG: calcium-translocating P-type ATPase, SERCA-type [Candidatus Aenigmatarchaeota archaeon]
MADNWHDISSSATIKKLESSENGLTESEAKARLKKYGLNVFTEKEKISKLTIFLNQFKNTLVIILIIAAIVSLVAESIVDAAVIFAIVIINAIIGFREEYNAEKAMEALKRLASPVTIVIRDGKKQEIETKFIVPGDIVVLEEGTKMPADMRLLGVSEMHVDESSLTGESTTITKIIDVLKDVPLADRKNMGYMGTVVVSGRGHGIVVSTGMSTEMGKIAELIQEAEEEPTPLQKSLKRFGKNLTALIVIISLLVMFAGIFRGGEFLDMVLTGIALAVAAIPEGLPAVVTITLTFGIKKMAKANAIVRRLPSVESLGSTTVICSDKTGTLTKNEMTVTRIYANSETYEVTGEGYEPKGDFIIDGKKIDPEKDKNLSILLKTGLLCNNSELNNNNIIGDPTEGALVVAAAKAFDIHKMIKNFPREAEIPFSSERKMMSTVNKEGTRKFMYTKGAPENVLAACNKIYKNGRVMSLTSTEKKEILEQNQVLANQALRVLGLAYKQVKSIKEKEKELVFLGLVGMIDPPRHSVKEDVKLCKAAGIRSVMITGDHKDTAVAVAREIGIFSEGDEYLTGVELEKLSDEQLDKVVEKISVYARVNPIQKIRIVKSLKRKGHIVAMTGDGVNDAPALKGADIGIAMGIKGTDVSKEASDMILKDDNFSTIVSAIREGRRIYDNIKKFIYYLLSCNLGEVLVLAVAMIIGFSDPSHPERILVPLTATQILWMNLVTDGLPATALGVDPPARNIMNRPPRNSKEKIISKGPLIDMIIVGVVMMIGTLYLFSIYIPAGAEVARTVAFTTIVMYQMFRVLSMHMSYNTKFLTNRGLFLAILSSIILQLVVIYVPLLQVAFGTVSLDLIQWGEILFVSFLVMPIMWLKYKIFDRN